MKDRSQHFLGQPPYTAADLVEPDPEAPKTRAEVEAFLKRWEMIASHGYHPSSPIPVWIARAKQRLALIDLIVDIVTYCPDCGLLHIDEGEWVDRLHRTHMCQNPSCGKLWRPDEDHYTRGVAP